MKNLEELNPVWAILAEGMIDNMNQYFSNFGQWFRRMILFKDYCISSSGVHFVKRSGTICALLAEGMMDNIYNLGQWFRRCCLKTFLILALVVILFSGVELFVHFW